MRMLLFLLLALIAVAIPAIGQVAINQFNEPRPDTLFWTAKEGETTVTLTLDEADKVEGAGAVNVRAVLGSYHPWGTYAQFGYTIKEGESPWDWSLSESLSVWIKVKMAPTHPEYMLFRVQIADQGPTGTESKEQYIWQDEFTIDTVTNGWVNILIPLIERPQPEGGNDVPDNTGFIGAPAGWGGFTYNNHTLDRDKIVEWNLGMITSGWTDPLNIPADSIEIMFDNYERFGTRAVPVVLFNGKSIVAPATTLWAWGNGSAAVEENAGPLPKTNAIKFVEGDAWGGWSGWGSDLTPTNMVGSWAKDSVQFKLKAEAGGDDTLRIQFESANGKRGKKFAAIRDNEWHSYKFALADLTFDDGAPDFDPSAVTKFGIMSNGQSVLGKIDYFTDIWTGNPVFDVIAPDAPTNILAVGGGYVNIVTWNDVPNEPGSMYNVYFLDREWTSLEDPDLEDVPPFNLPLGQQSTTHILRAPNTDQSVTYYYGVTAKDKAGNESPVALSTAVTTVAEGVPTIAMAPPGSFAADGDLSEWTGSSITPFVLSKQLGTAHVNSGGTITDDNDLSASAYLAADENFLYVAFDITDDIVNVDTASANNWQQDAMDLFIGLYDWRGKHHTGYRRGATPDYHFRFSLNRILIDNGGVTMMYQFPGGTQNPNYRWVEKGLEPGYTIEAKISFAELAEKLPGNDSLFSRVEGMRIPIDFEVNDRDAKVDGDLRDGMLCYSSNNDDNSWQDMWRWTYTWIGNRWTTGVERLSNVATTYELSQNFPNPFNPATQIRYSLKNAGMVSLKIYDLLGREVVTLVDGHQEAGTYSVDFSSTGAATRLTSGVYFYRLESGSFVSVKKMLLVK